MGGCMFARLLNRLLRCSHPNYTFPITRKSSPAASGPRPNGTYVVCLDCGQELPYDWAGMKISATQGNPAWEQVPQSIAG
jgi:hypothetical protein